MAVEVDGILLEWGDRLYRVRRKARPAPATVTGGKRKKPAAEAPKPVISGGQMKANLSRMARKVPEVMVKITSGRKDPVSGKPRKPCKDMGAIKAHFDYISRNGDVQLEDERGNLIEGAAAVMQLRDDWRYSGGYAIPDQDGSKREAYSIVLSMPPGTDRVAVKRAARDFAREHFSDHQYVFAAHDDEAHPHVHLCVRAVSHSLVRLNPRKADLQHWRESFAEQLRAHGIEANATPRDMRGRVFKAERQAVRHAHKRNASKIKVSQAKDVAKDAARESPTEHPAEERIRERRVTVTTGMRAMATALAQSPDRKDRKLALDVATYTTRMPAPKTAHRIAVETLKAEQASTQEVARSKGRAAVERDKDNDRGK